MDQPSQRTYSRLDSIQETEMSIHNEINFLDDLSQSLETSMDTLESLQFRSTPRSRGYRNKEAKCNHQKLVVIDERKWLKSRKKNQYIDFDDRERTELKKYFDALDQDDGGSIGLHELADPMIALGLAESHKEVEDLLKTVDGDGNGDIDFEEFLSIIKSTTSTGEKSAFLNLLTALMNGNLEGVDPELPFKMAYISYRRQKILDAMMSENKDRREEGAKVLRAYKRQLADEP